MKSFIIGKVIEPEIRTITVKATGERRSICSFGLLSGRRCENFDVWDGDAAYDKSAKFTEGDQVIAVVNTTVDKDGKFRCYLDTIAECPDHLRTELMEIVRSSRNGGQ